MVANVFFNPVEFFESQIPPEIMADFGRCVFEAYRLAVEECNANHPAPERRDVLPHIRNAHLNRLLRELAGRHPGMVATSQLNDAHNCRHTELAFKQIIVTASSVDVPTGLPRQADFRETLARDPQRKLFEPEVEEPMDQGGTLYCILTHCPADDQRMPESIRFAFPDRTCTNSLGHIDVLFRNPYLAGMRAQVTEVVVEPVEPKLKKASESA